MSILIKCMEMPKDCRECPFETYYFNCGESRCRATMKTLATDFESIPFDGRADNCPLIPIPPHGRLIDADALRASFRESLEECNHWANEVDPDTTMYARISQTVGTFVECSLRAKAAPTIIEAEEVE